MPALAIVILGLLVIAGVPLMLTWFASPARCTRRGNLLRQRLIWLFAAIVPALILGWALYWDLVPETREATLAMLPWARAQSTIA